MKKKILTIAIILICNVHLKADSVSPDIDQYLNNLEDVIKNRNKKAIIEYFADSVNIFVTMHGNEYKFHRNRGFYAKGIDGKRHHITELFFDDTAMPILGFRSKSFSSIVNAKRATKIIWDESKINEYQGTAVSSCVLWIRTGLGPINSSNDFQISFKKFNNKWLITGVEILEAIQP